LEKSQDESDVLGFGLIFEQQMGFSLYLKGMENIPK
jgi:hypothetical protein